MSAGGPDTVLIGFGDSPSAVEAAFSLLDAGFRVVVFVRAGRRSDVRHVRGVRVFAVTAPEDDLGRCRDDLRTVARLVAPAAVLPLDDVATWLSSCDDADLGAPVAGPTGRLTALAFDRRVQLAGAELVGLPVPPTVVCRTRADLRGLRTPVILRPALAVDAHQGRLMRTHSHRCWGSGAIARVAETWDERVPLLAQPLLRGRGEGIAGVATRAGIGAWSAQTPVRMADPSGSEPSACRSLTPDESVLDDCEALLGEAGWRGPFTLQFLRDADGRVWFIQLVGGCPQSLTLARHRGLEYPALAVAHVIGRPVRPPSRPRTADPVVARHLGREILHVLRVLRGPRTREQRMAGWPSRRATLRRVLRVGRGERLADWRGNAPLVLVSATVATIADAVAQRSVL